MPLGCQVDAPGVVVGEAGGRVVVNLVPTRGIVRRSACEEHERSIRGDHEGPVRRDEDHPLFGSFERTDRQLEDERGCARHRDPDLPQARVFGPVPFESGSEEVHSDIGRIDEAFQHGVLLGCLVAIVLLLHQKWSQAVCHRSVKMSIFLSLFAIDCEDKRW